MQIKEVGVKFFVIFRKKVPPAKGAFALLAVSVATQVGALVTMRKMPDSGGAAICGYVELAAGLVVFVLVSIFVVADWFTGKWQDADKKRDLHEDLGKAKRTIEDYESRFANMGALSADFHAFTHRARDLLITQASGETLSAQHWELLLTSAASVFKHITKDPMSVCVKFVSKDSGKVETLARDPASKLNRGKEDRGTSYTIDGNTAFKEASDANADSPVHFFCEDLVKAAVEGRYRNEHVGWEKWYKCTLVVPIRFETPEKLLDPADGRQCPGGHFTIVGFLAIDSGRTGVLNEENKSLSVTCAAAIADIMAMILQDVAMNTTIGAAEPMQVA
jgi:hypothetical protein